jgi:hypothetical protein
VERVPIAFIRRDDPVDEEAVGREKYPLASEGLHVEGGRPDVGEITIVNTQALVLVIVDVQAVAPNHLHAHDAAELAGTTALAAKRALVRAVVAKHRHATAVYVVHYEDAPETIAREHIAGCQKPRAVLVT